MTTLAFTRPLRRLDESIVIAREYGFDVIAAPSLDIVHGKAGSDGIDWVSAATIPGTLVILMGMDNAGQISEGLIEGGKSPDTPVAVITDGARPEQRAELSVLKDLQRMIADKGLKAPGIIVIGEVAKERERLGDLL